MFFFDIETTGLPKKDKTSRNKYFSPENLEAYDSSRIVSISWIIYDDIGNLFKKEYYIVKPDGFFSHPKALEVHNITHEEANKNGISIIEIFKKMKIDLINEHTIVGYNVNFDWNITRSEAIRYNDIELLNKLNTVNVECSQRVAIDNIPNLVCKYKFYPKMEEVIRYIFPNKMGETFNTSHNALDDTFQCAKIYYYIKKKLVLNNL
jgi:DNA polymerase III epsilon subunit-like protein